MFVLKIIMLIIIGIVLWVVGSKMQATYNNKIPKWQNRALTRKEFWGKAFMLVGSVSILTGIAYSLRGVL